MNEPAITCHLKSGQNQQQVIVLILPICAHTFSVQYPNLCG